MRNLILLLTCLSLSVHAFERLGAEYCISYGSPESKHKVTEYFSLSCPHCIQLFLSDFEEIRKECIESEIVEWVFHPIPSDLLTVQAMACIEGLNNSQKQIFLEEVFSAQRGLPADTIPRFMRRFCELCSHDVGDLDDLDLIERKAAFQSAFEFVKQGTELEGVPSIELDGVLQVGAVPSLSWCRQMGLNRRHFSQ